MKTTKLRLFMAAAIIAASVGTSVVVAAPAQAAGRCIDNVYSRGSNSVCVVYAQRMLNAWSGHYHPAMTKLAADGAYGYNTASRVTAFQNLTNGLLVSDGVLGPKTWKILCNATWGVGNSQDWSYRNAAGCNPLG